MDGRLRAFLDGATARPAGSPASAPPAAGRSDTGAQRRGVAAGLVSAAAAAWLLAFNPAPAQPGAPPVPLTEGQGSRELRQRLDQDGYSDRLGPAGLERGRALGEGFHREWLEQRASQARPLPPVLPGTGVPAGDLQGAFDRERADQRRLEQARQAEQARLRDRAASPGGLAPGEVGVTRQRLQAQEAAGDLGARMLRLTAPPAGPAAGPDWLTR